MIIYLSWKREISVYWILHDVTTAVVESRWQATLSYAFLGVNFHVRFRLNLHFNNFRCWFEKISTRCWIMLDPFPAAKWDSQLFRSPHSLHSLQVGGAWWQQLQRQLCPHGRPQLPRHPRHGPSQLPAAVAGGHQWCVAGTTVGDLKRCRTQDGNGRWKRPKRWWWVAVLLLGSGCDGNAMVMRW